MKFVLIIGAFLSFSCFASNNDLVEDANRLCSKISLEGFSKELKFKGLAKAELDKILKRVGLGAEAKGEVDSYTIEFSGVFQKDLAKVIENNDNCKVRSI
ncbi:hypothetical protein [Pseudoalteromonas sp. B62]|uniref:hypothetical protein n=1 Tax=Pseudoalteromonas sp. B62 TaxID=630483 RepID=UPI00301BD98A